LESVEYVMRIPSRASGLGFGNLCFCRFYVHKSDISLVVSHFKGLIRDTRDTLVWETVIVDEDELIRRILLEIDLIKKNRTLEVRKCYKGLHTS
jgi:hypothetical protein